MVASKVHFTKSIEDLEGFVPRNRIVKEMGGDDDYSYQYVEPHPDENARMSDEATKATLLSTRLQHVEKYEQATLQWLSAPSDSEQAREAQIERGNVREALRRNYWEVDPYLRARTIYDRTGLIKEGGVIDLGSA